MIPLSLALASLRPLGGLASSTCLSGFATYCFLRLLKLPLEVDDVLLLLHQLHLLLLRAHRVCNWCPVVYESPFCSLELGCKNWESQFLCSNDTSSFLSPFSAVPVLRGFAAPRNG